jgi:hypothetical protein
MDNQQHTLNIIIAEFSIQLLSDSILELEEGYLPFMVDKIENEPDITIQCFAGIPENPFENDILVFEAENEEQKFYSIYKVGNELGFIIYNQQTKNEIQQIALLDSTFTHWKVYSKLTPDNHILALKYPLGPIVMLYMTLNSDAVLMHASCAYDGTSSRIFSGFSGAGKSTISQLWAAFGNSIINDDRIIIRKQQNGYFVHNTPMYYKDMPKKAPLSSIYLISHFPENKAKRITGALAISKVMAFCIQNNFDRQFIQSRLNFFSELCLQIPVYELGFVPNESVVNYVLANEAGRTN